MLPHLLNLLGRSWDTMIRGTGTTTLGFFVWVIALTAVGWAATLAAEWLKLKRNRITAPFWNALRGSRLTGIFLTAGIVLIVVLMFEFFLARTVYEDHEDLAAAIRQLKTNNAKLSGELETRKHGIPNTDPVFANTIYLLRAFDIYRHDMKGAPCVIFVTAPPDSGYLPSAVAQFSNSVSDCSTFGPLDYRSDPDIEKETVNGMMSGLIIFHADKDDIAANQLFNNLGNLIQVKRSYQSPPTRNFQVPQNARLVWLQFGPNMRWNSELSGNVR